MEYSKKGNISATELVNETLELFDTYSGKRDNWAIQAKEDKEFRLGRQWSAEQKETLESMGQAPIVINRDHRAVESAKAMLTSNRPSFRCAPREDSDNKVAQIMGNMLAYMYDISDGRSVIRQVVDDYYVMGIGYINVYQEATSSTSAEVQYSVAYGHRYGSGSPDFTNDSFIIECKGIANESFPIRWKLFKRFINRCYPHVTLYKPQNQKECDKVIELIIKTK